MQALLLEQPGRLVLLEQPRPDRPAPGEALVRLRCGGICGTDMHAFRGTHPFFTYPLIPGHEVAVEILDVPENEYGLKPGSICAADPYFECRRCRPCLGGRTNCCEQLRLFGIHFDGGFREIFPYPLHKLYPSEKASAESLALAEPLTVGAHAVNRARLVPGERILVAGAGPIGLAVIASLPDSTGPVAVIDVRQERLDFCRRWKGIERTLLAGQQTANEVSDLFGGELPEVVFDATGNAPSMNRAFDLTASGGRLILVGLVPGAIRFSDPDFHRKELSVFASRNGTAVEFKEVIRHIETGRIDPAPLITARCPLLELPGRLPKWIAGDPPPIKALVTL